MSPNLCKSSRPVQRILSTALFTVLLMSMMFLWGILWPVGQAAGDGTDSSARENSKILVEIFMPRDQKNDLEKIRKDFSEISITRIRAQFTYPAGLPLENIAIGRNVPAHTARHAIEIAQRYNRGVRLLLLQIKFPQNYIAIGTSAFDELSQIPITPEDLRRLSDPALTTPQFHTLYRSLTGEDKRFGHIK